MMKPQFGEIWMCNLVERSGSVQSGYRPVFILSNNVNNTYSPTLNVIPLTSRISKKHLPVHVELFNYSNYGLRMMSTLLVEQVATIPAEYLSVKLGQIDDDIILEQIFKAIEIQFPVVSMFAQKGIKTA